MAIELNEDQKTALDNLSKFILKDSNDMALLEGPAGSGKTTTLQFLIENVINNSMFGNIVLSAPTHKALKVMKKMIKPELRDQLQFFTLHSLLGLKHQITKEGNEIFVKDKKTTSKFTLFDVIIVDESSMIADQLFKDRKSVV